jgi:molybdopterin-guanine dinucleotide biosynthesis protein A
VSSFGKALALLPGQCYSAAVPLREDRLSAVVLAGGRNTRMGGLDKGRIPFRGVPLAVRAVRLLAGLFQEVILVTNNPEAYPELSGLTLLTADRFQGCGPLGGLHAGLLASSRPAALCLACDLPNLSADFIRRQTGIFFERDCEVLLPRVRGEVEPLHAIYRKSLIGPIEKILNDGQGYSIRRLFPLARTEYLDLEDEPEVMRMFANINLPEDLDVLRGQP